MCSGTAALRPWRGRAASCFCSPAPRPAPRRISPSGRAGRARAYVEDVLIKSEGLGGILGFGKKGGVGFKLVVTPEEGEPLEMELVSGLGTYLEVRPDKRVQKRAAGRQAPARQRQRRLGFPCPWSARRIEGVLRKRWLELINGVERVE